MKRVRVILCLSFLFLTCVFSSQSSAQWNGGTTPNLSLPLPSYNISLFELLTQDLQGIDSMFGETTLTYSATMTAWSSATTNDVTLAGNPTINFTSTPLAGEQCRLWVIQPATGGPYTVTWGNTIKWAGGSAPTLTSTASKKNLISCQYINSTLGWHCEMDANVF